MNPTDQQITEARKAAAMRAMARGDDGKNDAAARARAAGELRDDLLQRAAALEAVVLRDLADSRDQPGGLSVTDAAAALRLSRPTVYDRLRALER